MDRKFLIDPFPIKLPCTVFNDLSARLQSDLSALYHVLLLTNMVREQDMQHILPLERTHNERMSPVPVLF